MHKFEVLIHQLGFLFTRWFSFPRLALFTGYTIDAKLGGECIMPSLCIICERRKKSGDCFGDARSRAVSSSKTQAMCSALTKDAKSTSWPVKTPVIISSLRLKLSQTPPSS
jgi:hypothetical protein